ncbi:unnamed protein product [Cylicocyclus nassatus]|uniref:Uncharacterized protein n=1 Tax=Cylicocyclus nassatus TaxID=53992 RepID=A0AA36GKA0_CYLNA|nr:unnamed protein product [Cylicocyclus nassatus]
MPRMSGRAAARLKVVDRQISLFLRSPKCIFGISASKLPSDWAHRHQKPGSSAAQSTANFYSSKLI